MKYLKIRLYNLLFLILSSLLLLACHAEDKSENPPNIVLFLVDDLGWKDLSTYGSDFYQTPNVDQLAKEGVKFTDAYSTCTVCSPTRASILTGKYPAHLNCTDWIKGHTKPFAKMASPDWTKHIPDGEATLSETLKALGYHTAHIGKWHLGEEEKHWPENYGFDINIGGWKMGMPKKVKGKGGYFVPYHNPKIEDGPEGEYLTERLADEAVNFIKTNKEKPFFLNYWLYSVHTPLQAKEEYIQKYDSLRNPKAKQSNPIYAAMVQHMDEALGKVIGELKASGVYENTIFIFASDNGGLVNNNGKKDNNGGLVEKAVRTSNYPLRSGKGDIYEGGVRVPLIISWPGKIAGNRTTEVVSTSTDLFPTILGLIGHTDKLKNEVDGVDLSQLLLEDQKPERKSIFWHYPHYHTEGATPYSAIRKGDWKLIYTYETDSLELYHLKNDIGETANLIADQPDKVQELKQELEDWKKKVNAQEPSVNPNYDPEKENTWKNNWN